MIRVKCLLLRLRVSRTPVLGRVVLTGKTDTPVQGEGDRRDFRGGRTEVSVAEREVSGAGVKGSKTPRGVSWPTQTVETHGVGRTTPKVPKY